MQSKSQPQEAMITTNQWYSVTGSEAAGLGVGEATPPGTGPGSGGEVLITLPFSGRHCPTVKLPVPSALVTSGNHATKPDALPLGHHRPHDRLSRPRMGCA